MFLAPDRIWLFGPIDDAKVCLTLFPFLPHVLLLNRPALLSSMIAYILDYLSSESSALVSSSSKYVASSVRFASLSSFPTRLASGKEGRTVRSCTAPRLQICTHELPSVQYVLSSSLSPELGSARRPLRSEIIIANGGLSKHTRLPTDLAIIFLARRRKFNGQTIRGSSLTDTIPRGNAE